MDAFRRLTLFTTLLLLLFVTRAISAQDNLLELFVPVSGSVEPGASQIWTFSAADGAMLSFEAHTTLGDLDPIITIESSARNFALANDDYDYPETGDSRIEGMTIPDTATYSVTVSGFGTTSGDYALTMRPGFSDVAYQSIFDDQTQWTTTSQIAEPVFGENRMAVVIDGLNEQAVMVYEAETALTDGYLYVEITEISGGAGWLAGVMMRQQADGSHYEYVLNQSGQWRFIYTGADETQIIRDWSTHPAIVAGAPSFTLGLVANGVLFEFFYNGQLIGRLTDTNILEAGDIGVVVGTPSDQTGEVVAQYENLVVTIPGDTLIPEQIAMGDSNVMIPKLQRRRLIPTTGDFGLIVPESFLTHNRAGVNEFTLGGSQTFSTFVLGATITWEISTPTLPAGCGLILRATDETNYFLAYLDQTGTAGLSLRQGDVFEPGIVRENIPIANQQRLLIVADDSRLIYYANGQLVGTLDTDVVAGAVGNAVINFEPVTTSCQFDETWVWAWE